MAETFRLSEEVTRMLADSIVQREVIEPMEKIGWRESVTPPALVDSDNPNPTEGAPTPAPSPAAVVRAGDNPQVPIASGSSTGEQKTTPTEDVIDLDQFKDPTTGKYFGKYPSKAEALKGVGHVVQMAKSAFSRNAELEIELAKLRAVAAPSSPAATPAAVQPATQEVRQLATATLPKSPKLEQVLTDLVENGGVLDAESMKALMDGISDQSRLVAEQAATHVVESRESAISKDKAEWDAVDERLKAEMPTALQFADEIGLHVQSNPLLSAGVAAMVARGDRFGAALEAAKSYFAVAGIRSTEEAREAAELKEEQLMAKDAVRREATEQARRDAGVFGSSTSGVHQTPGGVGPTPEQIAAAGAEMQATGLGQHWRSMTITRTLTDPIFDR